MWDEEKNQKSIAERGISFGEVAACILKDEVLDVMKNPVRSGQFYFIMKLKDYTHVVPFVINENEEIILKTVFPNRKLHKKFGGKE